MIHTFMITHQIDAIEYWRFKEIPGTVCYERRMRDKYGNYRMVNRMLDVMGIVLYADKYKIKNRPDYFCFRMFVNPAKVLGRNRVVDIYTPDMYEEFEKQFNCVIKSFGIHLPSLRFWKAARIDFTQDVKTEYVELYIRLLQKAYLKGYWYPKNAHNNSVRFRKGSLYCKMQSHTLNFYDKQNELKKDMDSGKRPYDPDELNEAENILRLEVQCRKSKIQSLQIKYGLKGRYIRPFLQREDIAKDVMNYYLKKICGTMPYYKKPGAINRIGKSRLNAATKERMIQVVNAVSLQYSSLDKVSADYENFRELLERFGKIGVNPVTINKNASVSVGLPSLYELIN